MNSLSQLRELVGIWWVDGIEAAERIATPNSFMWLDIMYSDYPGLIPEPHRTVVGEIVEAFEPTYVTMTDEGYDKLLFQLFLDQLTESDWRSMFKAVLAVKAEKGHLFE